MDEKFDVTIAMRQIMVRQCNSLFDTMTAYAQLRKSANQKDKGISIDDIHSLKQQVSSKLEYLCDGDDITIKDLPYCEPSWLNEAVLKAWLKTTEMLRICMAHPLKPMVEFKGPITMATNKKYTHPQVPLIESTLVKSDQQGSGSPIPSKFTFFDPEEFMKVTPKDIEKILSELDITQTDLDVLLNFEQGTVSKYIQGEAPSDDHNKTLYTVRTNMDVFKKYLYRNPKV